MAPTIGVVGSDERGDPAPRSADDPADGQGGGGGERIGARRPQVVDTRGHAASRGGIEHACGGEPADRHVFPWHDDLRGRYAQHRQRHIGWRRVALERDDGADGAGQCFWRRSEDRRSAEPQRTNTAFDDLALRRAGAQDDRRFAEPLDPADHRQPFVALPLAGAGPIREHEHRRACRGHDVCRAGHARRKRFNGRRLRDVERFANSDLAPVVHQANAGDDVAAGEVVRERAAQLAGADDGDVGHWWTIVASRASGSRLPAPGPQA